jgi:general secretion pathway protein C
MYRNRQSFWWSRFVSFVLAGLAAGSVAYWFWLRSGQDGAALTPYAVQEISPLAGSDLARLLGRPEPDSAASLAPVVNGRFALTGVLAGSGTGGAALISVDGKAAKSYKIGDLVADQLYLQSVARRSVVLSDRTGKAETTLALEMKPFVR